MTALLRDRWPEIPPAEIGSGDQSFLFFGHSLFQWISVLITGSNLKMGKG